jgi:hypothetical protein
MSFSVLSTQAALGHAPERATHCEFLGEDATGAAFPGAS